MRDVSENFGVPVRTSNPSAPVNGDFWYRSDEGKFFGRTGGVTTELAKGSLNPVITSGRWYKMTHASGYGILNPPVASTMYLCPFFPGRSGTLNGLAYEVTTQGVSASGTDQVRFGLYDDDDFGSPTGAALWDSGLQNLEVAPGVKTLAVSWTGILPKLYWFAVVRQTSGTIGTAAAMRTISNPGMGGHFIGDTNATPLMGSAPAEFYTMTGVTGALPTIGTIASATGDFPVALFKFA